MEKIQMLVFLLGQLFAVAVFIAAIIVAVKTRKSDSKVIFYISLAIAIISGIYCFGFAIGWVIEVAAAIGIAAIAIAIYKKTKEK